MCDMRKFTVIYYGYMRQCPTTIHSHLEQLYLHFSDARCVFSVWGRMWDCSPLDHPRFELPASQEYLPRWLDSRLAAWSVHQPDQDGMQELVRANSIPATNCFGQQTWRVASYCKSLQDASRTALSSSTDEYFLYCRPDLRFENEFKPHIPDGCDCASNCGIDWLPDGSRRIGQAAVKGMNKNFLDQLFFANRRCVERISTLFDELPRLHRKGVEVNYETLVGWHLHGADLRWTAANLAHVSLIRPRGVVNDRLHILYPTGVGPAVEH